MVSHYRLYNVHMSFNFVKEKQTFLVCLDVKTTTGVKHMKVYCTTEPDGSQAYSFSQASTFPFFSELNLCVTPNQVMWFGFLEP
jgi:hypothetical protein